LNGLIKKRELRNECLFIGVNWNYKGMTAAVGWSCSSDGGTGNAYRMKACLLESGSLECQKDMGS